jgi:hypothetical protein
VTTTESSKWFYKIHFNDWSDEYDEWYPEEWIELVTDENAAKVQADISNSRMDHLTNQIDELPGYPYPLSSHLLH